MSFFIPFHFRERRRNLNLIFWIYVSFSFTTACPFVSIKAPSFNWLSFKLSFFFFFYFSLSVFNGFSFCSSLGNRIDFRVVSDTEELLRLLESEWVSERNEDPADLWLLILAALLSWDEITRVRVKRVLVFKWNWGVWRSIWSGLLTLKYKEVWSSSYSGSFFSFSEEKRGQVSVFRVLKVDP